MNRPDDVETSRTREDVAVGNAALCKGLRSTHHEKGKDGSEHIRVDRLGCQVSATLEQAQSDPTDHPPEGSCVLRPPGRTRGAAVRGLREARDHRCVLGRPASPGHRPARTQRQPGTPQ